MSELKLLGVSVGDLWGPNSEDTTLGLHFSDGTDVEHLPMKRARAEALQSVFAHYLNRQDATRYHWLRLRGASSDIAAYRVNDQQLGEDQFELICGNDLDEAVDAAMKIESDAL